MSDEEPGEYKPEDSKVDEETLKKLKENEPLPGQQDSGEPRKIGEVPPKREDLKSGKSGGSTGDPKDKGA
jgi:hypothetical protein